MTAVYKKSSSNDKHMPLLANFLFKMVLNTFWNHSSVGTKSC